MEVILLEKIANLGELGDKVKVKAGYGRNYLIPQRKAVPATAGNIAEFEARRAELEKRQAETLEAARSRAANLEGKAFTIAARVGGEGKLFGSVGTNDIADAIVAAGIDVEKKEVRLPAGPLRETGDHEVELHLHADVDVIVTVTIVGEQDSTN